MSVPLPPRSRIGILGGGQLGRMLALAAARLGLRCHIYDPNSDTPAMQVSSDRTVAPFDDIAALKDFAGACDVVTYEFENVPAQALDVIEEIVPVRPGRRALSVSQDRLTEKTFLQNIGIKTADFQDVAAPNDIRSAIETVGPGGILKTRRFGYDGKGQIRLDGSATDADALWAELEGAPSIYEGFVPFDLEISVIAARGLDGAVAAYDPGENHHAGGILRRTTVPAKIPATVTTDAALIAGRILNALDYCGVIGVEFFVCGRQLIVNEIAPRVHNSGHWTQNGCVIDQFEQHIRAISGWPLGPATRHSDVVMENLIGNDVDRWRETGEDGLHLYGKAEARDGRKMGHINRIVPPKG